MINSPYSFWTHLQHGLARQCYWSRHCLKSSWAFWAPPLYMGSLGPCPPFFNFVFWLAHILTGSWPLSLPDNSFALFFLYSNFQDVRDCICLGHRWISYKAESLAQHVARSRSFISACWMNGKTKRSLRVQFCAWLSCMIMWMEKCLWLNHYPRTCFGCHRPLSSIFPNARNREPETMHLKVWKKELELVD